MDSWAPSAASSSVAPAIRPSSSKGGGKGKRVKKGSDQSAQWSQNESQQQQPQPRWKRRRVDGGRHEDGDLTELCRSTPQLSLETARRLRATTGWSCTTILVPEHPARLNASAVVASADADDHRPHVLRWAALVQGLAVDESLPFEARATLTEHGAQHANPVALMPQVKMCMCVPTYSDVHTFKVSFSLSPDLQPVAVAISQCLVAAGGSMKYGASPRSNAERAMGRAISALR